MPETAGRAGFCSAKNAGRQPDGKGGTFSYGKIFHYYLFGNRKIDLSQAYIKAVADMIASGFQPCRKTVCFCEGKVSLKRETESVISMSVADIGLNHPDSTVPSKRPGTCALFLFSRSHCLSFPVHALRPHRVATWANAGKRACRKEEQEQDRAMKVM